MYRSNVFQNNHSGYRVENRLYKEMPVVVQVCNDRKVVKRS